VTGGFAVLVVAFLSVEALVKTASTMFLISFALVNLSVIVLREARIPGYRPTFRTPLYPWLPLAAIAIYVFLIVEMGLVPLLITGGFLAVAAAWYLTYVHWRIDRKAAVIYMVRRILSMHIGRTRLEDELVRISLERDEVALDRFDRLVQNCPVLDIKEQITAQEMFRRLSETLSPRLGMEPDRVYQLFLDREQESSTVIQPGLAVPHVVVEGKEIFEMALVRCRPGVVFSELNPPVTAAFVLIGSRDQRNFHLKALMAIAHIVQESDFDERWQAARNEDQLRDVVILSRRERFK